MIEAAKKYNDEKDTEYSTYAYYWVEKYILRKIDKEINIDKAESNYDKEYFEDSVEKSATIEKEFEELSEQEQDVLILYAEGYTIREIASKEKIKVKKTRVHEIINNIETKPDKLSLESYNKLVKENKTKSKTSDDERYAFDDLLDKTREEAEYKRHKEKARPTYGNEYNPDEKIDFQGLYWIDFIKWANSIKDKIDSHTGRKILQIRLKTLVEGCEYEEELWD